MDSIPVAWRIPNRPFTVSLVRHAESRANAGLHEPEGASDTPLSPRGMVQAQVLRERFEIDPPNVTHVASSDLVRAVQTRDILATAFPKVSIFSPSKILRELSRGEDASSGFPDALKERMSLFGPHYRSPNGDSLHDIGTHYLEWIVDTINAIIEITEENAPLHLLIVGHGNAIKALFLAITHANLASVLAMTIENTGITTFTYDPAHKARFGSPWTLIRYNDFSHLANIE